MTDALTEFLRAASLRPFSFSMGWDCGRFVASWWKTAHGVEPGVEFIGCYRTALGLVRLLKRRGGMIEHFDQCLIAVGARRVDQPKRGDVAIVDAPEGPTGAVMIDNTRSASLLLNGGINVRSLPVLAAWTI